MRRVLATISVLLILIAVAAPASAVAKERRFALVIGNAEYKAATLATPVNDAALIAQTLRTAGFEVTGMRDLDGNGLTRAFHDFIEKIRKSGPDAIVLIYFAGIGLQCDGENFLVPVDADIRDASDVRLHGLQVSEQIRLLGKLGSNATFLIFDAARANPFSLSEAPLAGGLALVEPETNMLIAFNAAPGTVAPDSGEGYGPYAISLAEMIREGGISPADLFDGARLRVNELTNGAQVPWYSTNLQKDFKFFRRGPDAPTRSDAPEGATWMRSRPMRSLSAGDAYFTALLRDTLDAYAEFVAEYWHDPMTNRVRALLAIRREAITWRRSVQANVPNSYWTYLDRYPQGPHVADARRLLARLGAEIKPPAKFTRMEYDVPPPLPDEFEFTNQVVLRLNDPAFSFEAPKPLPRYFLEAPPSELLNLAPPAAASGDHLLAAPALPALPAYLTLPSDVAAPPHPLIAEVASPEKSTAVKPEQNATFSIPPPGSTAEVNKPVARSSIMSPEMATPELGGAPKATILTVQSGISAVSAKAGQSDTPSSSPPGPSGDISKLAGAETNTSAKAAGPEGAGKPPIGVQPKVENPESQVSTAPASTRPPAEDKSPKSRGIQSATATTDIWPRIPVPLSPAATPLSQDNKLDKIPLPRRRPLIRAHRPVPLPQIGTAIGRDLSIRSNRVVSQEPTVVRSGLISGRSPTRSVPPSTAAQSSSGPSSTASSLASRARQEVASKPKRVDREGKRNMAISREPPSSAPANQSSSSSSQAPSSKPERNPCTVSNGKLNCD